MEKLSLSVEQWMELIKTDESTTVPVWFHVVSNSMYPFIRANKDEVMLLPIKAEVLKTGDIVLFPVKHTNGEYCLHRIYIMDADKVQTMGDANRSPDGWIPKSDILGKAVMIRRGNITIDCEDPKWERRFRFWNRFWKIRPIMLLPFRIGGKCKNIWRKLSKSDS